MSAGVEVHDIKQAYCPFCHSIIDHDDIYCNFCHERVREVHTCPFCAEIIKPKDIYCLNCNQVIGSEEEIPDTIHVEYSCGGFDVSLKQVFPPDKNHRAYKHAVNKCANNMWVIRSGQY